MAQISSPSSTLFHLRNALTSRGRARLFWRISLLSMYLLATVQLAGCYFALVRPYINTALYEIGQERLPFQTRILMMPVMRWAHQNQLASASAQLLSKSQFWYLRPAEPEAMVQLWINIASLIIAGIVTSQIYRAAARTSSGPHSFLSVFVYPVFLLLCAGHYILHTLQNFRFIYDLPSLAFFSVGLYLIYFRKHPLLFAALFVVGTVNRETTLLLLPFFMLSAAVSDGRFVWKRLYSRPVLSVVLPLTVLWITWHFFVFHLYKNNVSEYYPRVMLNLYTLGHPRYWPQLFSAGGFLVPFVLIFRKSIADAQLRIWLWALPIWWSFMFFWGILVETRVFGELLPYLTCLALLVAEDRIRKAVLSQNRAAVLPLSANPVHPQPSLPEEEAA